MAARSRRPRGEQRKGAGQEQRTTEEARNQEAIPSP
jgi:hypothetical protein